MGISIYCCWRGNWQQYIYETGFVSQPRNAGLAAAASILMGLVLVVLTLVQLGIGRKNENKGKR